MLESDEPKYLKEKKSQAKYILGDIEEAVDEAMSVINSTAAHGNVQSYIEIFYIRVETKRSSKGIWAFSMSELVHF